MLYHKLSLCFKKKGQESVVFIYSVHSVALQHICAYKMDFIKLDAEQNL